MKRRLAGLARHLVGPLLVVALAASGCLAGLWLWSLASSREAASGRTASALAGFNGQYSLTRAWPEPWRAPFNIGTTHTQRREYDRGIASLEEALRLIPKAERRPDGTIDADDDECLVRINLSIALERRAQTTNAGKEAYEKAASVSAPCAAGGDPDATGEEKESEQARSGRETHARQEAKSGRGRDATLPSPTPTGEQAPPDEAEQRRRDALNDAERAQRERAENDGDTAPTPPTGRYW